MRLAIIQREKCKPLLCAHECKKYCPVEKKEQESCITIAEKAKIDENTCIGCSICVKRCPFGAIEIINLPSVEEKDIVHRYGKNGFTLYGLPTPKKGNILGMLGRNGIGKSTAIKLLSNQMKINLGSEATSEDVKKFFAGNELLRYFEDIENKVISYKPQNISSLAIDMKTIDLLKKRGSEKKIKELAKKLDVEHTLENKMNKLSGGELQRIAIIAASLTDSDVYFFDEPLAYLDIGQRLLVSDFIKEIGSEKEVIVIEHDLLILDYLTDYINVFYGGQGAFGIVSQIKSSKYGVNSYLQGFLKEENLRIRDKALNFNFTKNPAMSGNKIAEWPAFSVEFDSGFKLEAQKGEIHENHVIGILGKNGTGKTTFVKALAGELKTKENNIDLKLDISYKPQYLETESEESVRDIIFKEKINKQIASTFNLGVLASKKLKDLSGGELQRFSIARCVSKTADIYLLDEPSAYLDVEERISVAKAIKDIMTQKEKTAFVVDHDLLLISYLADSVINVEGISGKTGKTSEIKDFEKGISTLLKDLDITLRKEEESGRPRINKKGSVLDREQKERGEWAVF
ncbi:ribosome biogenesis/translation initiation ATPase RLI [archaeon]|jgi:ATP-binding cassette, sub-family E, member 1|nr:ribosome biogenesis/translation initiation ATPase RLI [archaeon]MBT6606282.1 ribosome biogenesis/translation initiation ATPase RLI [archaeon]MBT7251549.1 ribosome biogenesis/translation initiation ATPase RLI [archaeon]MBT7661190.1 ribosome biogenesis/translation initiation ATPase RLI [archaeon]